MKTLKGYIEKIRFQSPVNGFTTMYVVTKEGRELCVGYAAGFNEGSTVELDGDFVEHAEYGTEFKFKQIRETAPEDTASILRYLGSGAIKGLGEKLAMRIVQAFGEDTLRILEEEPERLSEIKGISPRKAREITDQMLEKKGQRDAMIFLQQYGLSRELTAKVYQMYGDGIYRVMRENPYRLADEIPAVGFKKADEIARKSGITADSSYRIRCAVRYVLEEAAAEGNCYLPKAELVSKTAFLLGLSEGPVEDLLIDLMMDHAIVMKVFEEEERIYLESFYRAEEFCAGKLLELRDGYYGGNEETQKRTRDMLDEVLREMSIELDEGQREAVLKAVQSGVFILSGGPGTGKTTTINAILRYLDAAEKSFELAAPTGRAAKRMTEATGFEAQTVHRLLEIGADPGDTNGKFYYGKSEENPIEADVVIVDEVSMLDIYLLKALLHAIPRGASLILVGDVDQLPSVGPGQILRDVIGCDRFPKAILRRIYRQSSESHIVEYAHRINEGQEIDLSVKHKDFFLLEKDSAEVIYGYIHQLVAKVLPEKLGIEGGDIQVLTPMRKGLLGVETLNKVLQQRLNPPADDKAEYVFRDTVFREGDRVMQVKNDYALEWEVIGKYGIPVESGEGVFNGDVGRILQINTFLQMMKVGFEDGRQVFYELKDLEELELAYAVTIHKSQGSEYPVVILPILSGPPVLMTRNLLYTAVTRARDCVIILGRGQTIQQMIHTDRIQRRYTSLGDRIRQMDINAEETD